MKNPLDRGAAAPVPTRGEGCTRRFDPDAVSDQHGADFAAAPSLWRAQQEQAEAAAAPADTESAATTILTQDPPDAATDR